MKIRDGRHLAHCYYWDSETEESAWFLDEWRLNFYFTFIINYKACNACNRPHWIGRVYERWWPISTIEMDRLMAVFFHGGDGGSRTLREWSREKLRKQFWQLNSSEARGADTQWLLDSPYVCVEVLCCRSDCRRTVLYVYALRLYINGATGKDFCVIQNCPMYSKCNLLTYHNLQ